MYGSGKERDFMPNLRKIEAAIPTIQEKKKVAAYARVSMQSERMLHSLSAQVSYYSGLIQKNPDWEYAGVYADDFISGTNTVKRDEFKRMLADCEDGKIDIILTKSISRFARNTVDLLETVRHLKDLGIEVRFEKKDFDTANLSRKSKIEQNTPRYAAILGNIKGHF
jgi:site-specific DNA recombinase